MTQKPDNGGPAFPYSDEGYLKSEPGISIRDWFAGQALVGLMSQPGEHWGYQDIVDAYEIADAMLAARAKGGDA